MTDYEEVRENRRKLRERMRAELEAAGLPFKKVEVKPVEPDFVIEENKNGRVMKWRNICGFKVEVLVRGIKVAPGDVIALQFDRDAWAFIGRTTCAAVDPGKMLWRKEMEALFVSLPEGMEVCTAVKEVIDQAIQYASLKV